MKSKRCSDGSGKQRTHTSIIIIAVGEELACEREANKPKERYAVFVYTYNNNITQSPCMHCVLVQLQSTTQIHAYVPRYMQRAN